MPARKKGRPTGLAPLDRPGLNQPLDGGSSSLPGSAGTPRNLPPLSREPSTGSTARASNPANLTTGDGVWNDLNANTSDTTRTRAFIRTPGGTQHGTSLMLSRAGTMIAPSKRERTVVSQNGDGEAAASGEDEEANDVVADLPVTTRSDTNLGLPREFTFTGYDIMADVPKKSPVKADPQDVEMARQLAVYHDMCRQLEVIPVSFVERKLLSRELRMRSHGLGSNGAKALAVTLVDNKQVTSLDLADNSIQAEGAKAIAQMLTANNAIVDLNVSENEIGFSGGCAISVALREKPNIRRLNLSGNKLKDEDGGYLAELVENNIYLREFILSHNEIGTGAARLLGKALVTNDTLERLDLSWNHIRGRGAEAVAYGLSKNSGLRVLNVSWNGFGREGCAAIGSALVTNTSLVELDMRCNRIYMEDMAAILKGLQHNTNLTCLKLAMNPITPDGALLLLRKLDNMEGSAIKEVDLSDIVVNSEFSRLLAQMRDRRALRIRHGVSVRHRQR